MQKFKQMPKTEQLFSAWFSSWYNKTLMRRIAIKTAWNQHLTTGREVHVCELFGHLVIIDSREKADINKAGQVGKMEVTDMAKASIWNSTAHRAILKNRAPQFPHFLP